MISSPSKQSLRYLFILSFSVIVFSLPLITLAQYQLLEPSLTGGETNFNLIEYLKLIYRTVLMIVIVISILMVAIGGVEYIFSQVPGAKVEGKQRITNAIVGLLIGLASYLILYTIDPSFVKFNLTNLKPVDIEIVDGPTGPGGGIGQPGGGNTNGGGNANNNNYTGPQGRFGPIPANEFEVRQRIKDATGNKVSFNDEAKGLDCKEGNEKNCKTYAGGLNEQQINGIINLANSCNCNLVVSGAAEPDGHSGGSSHYEGRAVDIRAELKFDQYHRATSDGSAVGTWILGNSTYVGPSNGGRYRINGTNSTCDSENSVHWHCVF